MSPEKVETFPGSWTSTLDWDDMADGNAYRITADEMKEAGVKLESVRVAAHEFAKGAGFSFRTRAVDGDLYIQAKS